MKLLRDYFSRTATAACLALTMVLTACGGGSGGESTPTPPPPPPAATAPAVTTAPASLTVTAGQPATFTVTASGTAPLAYQWQRGDTAVAGATSASYTLATTSVADSGSTWRVVVSNAAGSVTSAAATLTVNPAPVGPALIAQPVGTTVVAGTPANFSVQATGTAPLTYQWQRDGANIAGATAATYSLAAPVAADSGAVFRVVVSNSAGSVTSGNALLTVADAVALPTIAAQPQSANTLDGSTALVSVSVTGTGPFGYQWRRNGGAIAGATASTYITPTLTLADTGVVYSVVVTNGAGNVTSGNAIITVNPQPVALTAQPAGAAVTAGQTASFSAAATGSAPIAYQWRRNGVAIAGATSASYTTPATTVADNGALFTVLVSNAANNVTSNAATLTVTAAAVAPTIATAPASVTVSEGQTASFSVSAAGTAPLSYQWRRNAVDITGATAASYTTPATTVAADNAARFSVRVTNPVGSVTSGDAVLTVNAASSGLIGRSWALGQLLDRTDNTVFDYERVIDDSGRIHVVYLQSNGTRLQLFATRGTPNDAGTAPSWTAPIAIDVLGTTAVFSGTQFNYFYGLRGSPNGNAVAYWTFDAPCTASTYRTVPGTCQYVYTARFLASTGTWEAPVASGGFPGNPQSVSINNRGDISFAANGGTPRTNFPFYDSRPAVAWRALGDAAFRTQLLNGPVASFSLAMDASGAMLVGAALTQNATTDAASYRGTLAAGFGDAQVLDTRGAAVSNVTPAVGTGGQQIVSWIQNNGTRSSVYAATSSTATGALAVQDLGFAGWDYILPLDDGQIVLVDQGNLRRYRWIAGTWSAGEAVPNWQSGYFGNSNCALARNGDGICVNDAGLWTTYEAARNVVVQARRTTSPGAGYVLGFSRSAGLGAPVLSISGIAFDAARVQFDVLPTPTVPAGDGRNVTNLWGFFFK
jgi:hypothetical protein